MSLKFELEREHFPILKRKLYFDTPTFGLVPDYVWEATKRNIDERFHEQSIGMNGKRQYEILEEVRPIYAKLLGCEACDIAYGMSSSQLFTILSANLPVSHNDNVIIADNSFITIPFAFQAREAEGLEVRTAKTHGGALNADELLACADENTKVIAINHVESSTGFRYDMEKIGAFCRERDIIFAVDAAQSAGAMQIDVNTMNIDFLVGTDYKWLCHFRGVGFAYVSPELRKKLPCRIAGWGSDLERFNTAKRHLTPHPDSRRYECGGFHNIGIYSVSQVIEHYLVLGKEDVQSRILGLADYCYEKAEKSSHINILYPFAPQNRSGIIVLEFPKCCEDAAKQMASLGVLASPHEVKDEATGKEFYSMRIGLHYFLNRADIDKLFETIEGLSGGQRSNYNGNN